MSNNIIPTILLIKAVYDNREFIKFSANVTYALISYTYYNLPDIDNFLTRCKCRVCKYNKKIGLKPIH